MAAKCFSDSLGAWELQQWKWGKQNLTFVIGLACVAVFVHAYLKVHIAVCPFSRACAMWYDLGNDVNMMIKPSLVVNMKLHVLVYGGMAYCVARSSYSSVDLLQGFSAAESPGGGAKAG